LDNNLGKGSAIKSGILSSSGQYVLFTDCDLSTPVAEINKMLSEIEKGNYDIVIGSRKIKRATIKTPQPFFRRCASFLFSFYVRLLNLSRFKDTQCGFKIFKGSSAKRLFSLSTIKGYAFDIEILCLATILNYKIAEIPVMWHHKSGHNIHLMKNAFNILLDVLKIKLRMLKLKGKGINVLLSK